MSLSDGLLFGKLFSSVSERKQAFCTLVAFFLNFFVTLRLLEN